MRMVGPMQLVSYIGSLLAEPFRKLRSLYVLPPVLLPAFLLYVPLSFVNVTSWKLYLPLLRSLVKCDTPLSQYSGSLYCGDVNMVMSVALQQEAWLVAVKLVIRMVSGPILGALCDRHGRKAILMLSIGGFAVACFLMYLACIQSFVPPIVVLTIAMVVQGSTTAFGLCFKGMVADTFEKKDRAKGFVVLNHVDVLSRAFVIVFTISVQKVQLLHYDRLCLAAFMIGLVLLLCCHLCLHETLCKPKPVTAAAKTAAAVTNGNAAVDEVHITAAEGTAAVEGQRRRRDATPPPTSRTLQPASPAGAPQSQNNGAGHVGLSRLFAAIRPELSGLSRPLELLLSSRFLQIRLLQKLLERLAEGWESVQDSFSISVLGWGPGDWDLANVPISTGREVWGMLISGVMVHWAADPANLHWYVKATIGFSSVMLLVQNFAPWGPVFLLLPRYLLALMPGDGGASDVFFSSQFPGEAQATAQGLLTAADNMMSGLARGLFARFFDPAARGFEATYPLLARTGFMLLSNAVCLYSWSSFGGWNSHNNGNGKKD